jgi:hypothetical protein
MGMRVAGNLAISAPPWRIGAPCPGAQAIAVMVSQVAGRPPPASPNSAA